MGMISLINYNSRVRENTEVVIIYPDSPSTHCPRHMAREVRQACEGADEPTVSQGTLLHLQLEADHGSHLYVMIDHKIVLEKTQKCVNNGHKFP